MSLAPKFPRRDLVALKSIMYFLSAAGLFSVPPKGRTMLYEMIYNVYFLIAISSTTAVTIFTGVDLFGHLDDVDVLADHGVIFASLLVILIKQISLLRHRILVENWVADVERRRKSSGEIEMIHFAANDRQTLFYVKTLICIWILITASYLLPLYLGRPDQFELPTVNAAFFGVDSILEYVFLYSWNTAALSLAILGVFAVDVFMIGMYSQAASRLLILGDAFKNFGRDSVDCTKHRTTKSCQSCRSSVHQFVIKSVTEHCDVVKLVGELNHVFYWTLLVQSVFVAIIVAGCGFYGLVSILHGNISSFVKSMMYISGVIFENWLYCKFGDRLKSASLNIAEALFKSHWYILPREERMSALLIMQISENPLYMAAGKIFRMDLEHLGFILTSAYSYFTVLRNFA